MSKPVDVAVDVSRCAVCRFYSGNQDGGECRRRAPASDATGNPLWPVVLAEEVCGEFERRG